MANKKTAIRLLKLAKELVSVDEDKAYRMIKGSKFISTQITKYANALEDELEHSRRDIEGLEKVGSARIEAPKLLANIKDKVDSMRNYLTKISDAIDDAL